MKKVINNKLYDTETAKEVGFWENAGSWSDFSHVEETLYRKKTGEFFLYGEGGASTKYAVSEGQNSWTGGSKIIPITVEAAREWAEKKLDADKYAAIFGMPDEGDKTTVFAQIPAGLAAKAKLKAAEKQISLKDFLVYALEQATQD